MLKNLKPRDDGKRHDCCDFCVTAGKCDHEVSRCCPDPNYPLEHCMHCRQCFEMRYADGTNPYFEPLILHKGVAA